MPSQSDTKGMVSYETHSCIQAAWFLIRATRVWGKPSFNLHLILPISLAGLTTQCWDVPKAQYTRNPHQSTTKICYSMLWPPSRNEWWGNPCTGWEEELSLWDVMVFHITYPQLRIIWVREGKQHLWDSYVFLWCIPYPISASIPKECRSTPSFPSRGFPNLHV